MISIDSLTVAYGGFTLLDGVSFHISEKDKIGLVGKNGAGKSTLMKLLCGLQSPTSGQIDIPPGVTVGYLPQIMAHNRGRSVLDETMTVFSETADLEARIAAVTQELSERTDYESPEYLALIELLSELNDRLSVSHGEPPEVQARKTLLGLGFKEEEFSRPTETLSQGWNMRIELAKILLRRPE
ncbi:MAG: ABC-F family ATP-binding cassette domain-containing protein, partial [Bacteroidales bacterium]|nr:ABC-F family ATP-binding cassette domain-containing protein [Bacteroidales bacterium]